MLWNIQYALNVVAGLGNMMFIFVTMVALPKQAHACGYIPHLRQYMVLVTRPAPSLLLLTTRILVLKFVNKGVFFEEIQDSDFPRKRGYF